MDAASPNIVYASPQEERDDLKAIRILLEDLKEKVLKDSVILEPGSCSVPHAPLSSFHRSEHYSASLLKHSQSAKDPLWCI